MILSELIKVTIGNKNFRHYKALDYSFKGIGSAIYVKLEHVTKGSHSIVNLQCDYCNEKYFSTIKNYFRNDTPIDKDACFECRYLKMKDCCIERNGVENVFQLEVVKSKLKETNLERYGFENVAHNEEVKRKYTKGIIESAPDALIKRKKTTLDKYGVDNVAKVDEIKESWLNTKEKLYGDRNYNNSEKQIITRISLGNMIPDEKLSDYESYERKVLKLTKRNKKQLFESWDGYDYYDKEYIKDNLSLFGWDRLAPSVDHKISTMKGFLQGISAEEISDIKNLCITKRYINSSKNFKTEEEFYNWLKNNKISE